MLTAAQPLPSEPIQAILSQFPLVQGGAHQTVQIENDDPFIAEIIQNCVKPPLENVEVTFRGSAIPPRVSYTYWQISKVQ